MVGLRCLCARIRHGINFILAAALGILIAGVFAATPAAAAFSLCEDAFFSNQTRKYPGLQVVLENPDAFLAEMSKRFEARKVRTPNTPYEFDYSEIGRPLVRSAAVRLARRIEDMSQALTSAKGPRAADLATHLEHLKMLANEAQDLDSRAAISYRATIEFGYFFTRAFGQFAADTHNLIEKTFLNFDRTKVNGYEQLSAAEELASYRRRAFQILHNLPSGGGFKTAETPFVNAYFNPDKLEVLVVPTDAKLGPEVLLRLMWKSIHLVGVAEESVLADGILRPPGDFWNHDVRHESAKYYRKKTYIADHHLSPEQVRALEDQIQTWYLDLRRQTAAITDPQLRRAVGLYLMMKFGGEGVRFSQPLGNLNRAAQWLRQFWQARRFEEDRILTPAMAGLPSP